MMKINNVWKAVAVMSLLCLGTFTAFANTKKDVKYLLSSHILDITSGKPAAGVKISLYKQISSGTWKLVDEKLTDENGRITDFLPEGNDNAGIYKLTYHTAPYFKKMSVKSFYPYIDVIFEMGNESHYHVPITLSPYGYSTYRGS